MKLCLVFLLVAFGCSTAFSADVPSTEGTVVHVRTGSHERDKSYNERLHFCLFENGDHDLLYAGTKHGMWSDGWIELTIKNEKVFTGSLPDLTYGGTIIDLGNVLEEQPKSNFGQSITKIKGRLK